MSNRIRAIFLVALVVFCMAGAALESQSGEPITAANEARPQPTIVQETEPKQSYVGSDACFTCHRVQGGSWSETTHAKSFEHLPEKYRTDSSCLACHVTAYGEPTGYNPGMTAEAAGPFLNVGCESCHGPGAIHVAGVQKWMTSEPADEEKLLKAMKDAILRTPPDSQCAVCHQNQTHQSHPAYDGQPLTSPLVHGSSWATTSTAVSHPPSPDSYSVKTCASCHYEQYKTWRIDKHVGLSTMLTANYANDPKCLECHQNGEDTSQWHTATTDPQALVQQVGVGCESCHGSGLKHVLFNKQHISGPRLGPELEQAARQSIRDEKPVAACVQCHVRERHGEHLKFEKPEVEKPNAEKPNAEKPEVAKLK
jgi:hypothetical protein